MDWIRLGQSGRDLTGVGPRAGTLSVSPRQLAQHCVIDDAWIAIRGKVYNITAYLAFHPGGPEELMRGSGKDATQMFNEVHAWVNYESILQKCLVGRLTAVEPDIDTEALFFGTVSKSLLTKTTTTSAVPSPTAPRSVTNGSAPPAPSSAGSPARLCPRFDWIQKMDYITTIFYTTAYSNPEVQITAPTKQNEVSVTLIYSDHIYTSHLHFSSNIHWPCRVTINYETGKVEVNFRKILSKVWDNYGTLKQTCKPVQKSEVNIRVKYIVMNKMQINHNTCLLALQRNDGVKQTVPIGKHNNVYGTWNGQDISRSYTPVPSSFMQRLQHDQEAYAGDVCLMVKGYPQGMLSPFICSRLKGDTLELSQPLGSFDLQVLEPKEAFLLLAAGTGITPMMGLLLFLLERRQRRCQKVTLLFFNRKEEDILCREHLDNLQNEDNRFIVEHILSEPSDNWTGQIGHINAGLLKSAVDQQCVDNHLFPADIFACVCGPTVFTNLSRSLLHDMGYRQEHMHCFVG